MGGNEHNDACPRWGRNILYCIRYEMGYTDGYYLTPKTVDNLTRG